MILNSDKSSLKPTKNGYYEPFPLTLVKQFHITFNHPIENKSKLIDSDRARLRVKLIQEELNELTEAYNNKDLVEILDALADLQYVLSGAIIEFGMADIFAEAFNLVHRSNMSKVCKTKEEAQETVLKYKDNGVDCYYNIEKDYFVVRRTEDDKILKSINYKPVNLEKIINKQLNK